MYNLPRVCLIMCYVIMSCVMLGLVHGWMDEIKTQTGSSTLGGAFISIKLNEN